MTYICKYCGRVCKTQAGLGYHENRCSKNPNRIKKQKSWNTKIFTKLNIISKIKTTSYKLADDLEDKEYRLRDKLNLICPIHGNYSTSVNKIFSNKFCGCNKCGYKEGAKSRGKITTEEWIKRFRKIHGDKYDYSKVDINNTVDGKVIIICPIHGEFLQHPKNHADGQGCLKCYHIIWNNSDECRQKLINTVNEVFKEKYIESSHIYSFEKTVITGLNKEIVVTCKEHGDFITTPKSIMNGHGCKKCGELNRNASHTHSLEDWINKFNQKHNNKYDYSKVDINNKINGKITIICPIHGEFRKTPVKHLIQGCPKCSQNFNFFKYEKLNILTEYDLNNLHWTIILDLIGEDKLPAEFSKLCKFGENTPERKKMIQDLIDTYNIDVDEPEEEEIEDNTIDENIEEEVLYIPEEELLNKDIYNEDEETELKPLKEIKEISKIIKEDNIEVFSTGDKWLHIISKEMSKLWNAVLRDNENHNTNTVNDIKNKLNGTLTKFEEYIYTEFLKQYEEVINMKIS